MDQKEPVRVPRTSDRMYDIDLRQQKAEPALERPCFLRGSERTRPTDTTDKSHSRNCPQRMHCSENLPQGVSWGAQNGMNGFSVAFRSRERTLMERHVRRRKRAFAERKPTAPDNVLFSSSRLLRSGMKDSKP
jgi:hypothetical protein